MYRLFAPYWKGTMPLDHLERFAVHQRLPDVPVQSPAGAVPRDYTAVRFHFNESFPETADNRAFVARTVRMLAEAGEVVLLRPGSGTTNEAEAPIEPHPHVRVAAPAGSIGENLEAQRQVIACARMFVGTHGGFSHLASLQSVPSLSVYSHRAKLSSRHVELSQKIAGTVGASAYVIDTHDVSLFGLGFLERIAAPGRERPDAAAVRA
jgi:ADP-heptose:LPS heptosyltransferase